MAPVSTTTRIVSASVYTVATRKNSPPVRKHVRRTSSAPCTPTVTSQTNATMPPFDSPKPPNNKPLMPTLASTRTAKSPFTPRLAAPQHIAQTATGTPLSIRSSARSDVGGSAKSAATSKDDLSTPVKAFINNNVTPRSSSRKTRVDSSHSTPDGSTGDTPTPAKFTTAGGGGAVKGQNFYNGGNSSQPGFSSGFVSGSGDPTRPQSMLSGVCVTPGYSAAPRPKAGTVRSAGPSPSREESSMFVHADEAKSQPQMPSARPQLKKEASFFYANGQKGWESSRGASKSPSPVLPPVPAIGTMRPQFFHADGSADGGPQKSQHTLLSQSPAPIVGQHEIRQMVNPSLQSHTLRPPSPSKENIHLSYRKGASQVIRPKSILPPRESKDEVETKRSSAISSIFGHSKTASSSSLNSVSVDSGSRRPSLATQSQPVQAPLNVNTAIRKVTPPALSSPPAVGPLSPDSQTYGAASSSSTSLSPPKAGASVANQWAELAANARRERKVMDLEISNSSLLAINKQLEKQMRSQKTELRRYRRLTRAGRLSMATTNHDDAVVSDGEAYLDSEDEGVRNDSSLLSDDDSDDSDDSALSASALAEHDSRKIAKDEKRLRLDLSKHRQLLVDSQKMNQSLRRCLGWTEELINEGKKALSYSVRVSDVKLGGRVLRRDEDLEERSEEQHADMLENGEEADLGMEHEEEDDEVEDPVGDVMGTMSPWMGLNTQQQSSRDEATSQWSDGSGSDMGSGIAQAMAGADAFAQPQPSAL